MNQSTAIKLFQDRNVRVVWDENQEKYYFSVVDVVAVLTDSDYQTARNYWKVLKNRLSKEGASESVTKCNQLKMKAADGKYYKPMLPILKNCCALSKVFPLPKRNLSNYGWQKLVVSGLMNWQTLKLQSIGLCKPTLIMDIRKIG